MTDRDPEARRRALPRAHWPGRVIQQEDEPDLTVVNGSPGELVGMVYELTLAAWAMSGKPMPSYTRAEMPGRLIRAVQ